jgi:hypothetical protein
MESTEPIRFSFLLKELTTKAYLDLNRLSESLMTTPKQERAPKLFKYFKKQRIRFMRLLVLLRWGVQQRSDLQAKQTLIEALQRQETALAEAVGMSSETLQ